MATQKRPIPSAETARSESTRSIENIFNDAYVNRAFSNLLSGTNISSDGATSGQVLTADGIGGSGWLDSGSPVTTTNLTGVWGENLYSYFGSPTTDWHTVDISGSIFSGSRLLNIYVQGAVNVATGADWVMSYRQDINAQPVLLTVNPPINFSGSGYSASVFYGIIPVVSNQFQIKFDQFPAGGSIFTISVQGIFGLT